MVSSSSDSCDWCRRPFDDFFDARAGIPKAAQQKKPIPVPIKIGASILAILVAVYSLAQMRTAPDAAQFTDAAPSTITSGVHLLPPATSSTLAPPEQKSSVAARAAAPINAPSISTAGPNQLSSPPSTQKPLEQAIAKLASVHITTQRDADGNETAVGTVVIANQSPFEIGDFSLSIIVNGAITQLMPFEGNVNYPMALSRTRVPAHGNLQVSVMSSHPYNSPEGSSRTVKLDAHFEGAQQAGSDTIPLSPSS
jgi:hypothetical protein